MSSHPLYWEHHTISLYDITIGICIASFTIEYITSLLYEIKPTFLWHHTHRIKHRIDVISVTTSTLLMISQQLYLWDLIHYICRYHIHCIQQHIHYIRTITATVPVSHIYSFHDITPFVYMTSHPIYLITQPLHLSGHTHSIDAITKLMEVITSGTHMKLYTVYTTSHSHLMTSILSI